MPINIRELVIRAIVEDKEDAANSGEGAGAGNKGNNEKLIAECVEQVMEILNTKMER